MKLVLAKAAYYAGSALVGLACSLFVLAAMLREPYELTAYDLTVLAGVVAVGAAGEGLRQWSRGYYFPCRRG